MPFLCFFFLLLLAAGQSIDSHPATERGSAKKISVPGVNNAGRVSERLYRGSQPSIQQLVELKRLGVSTIVDLRAESSRIAREEKVRAESLGIRFVRIPIRGFSNPRNSDLATFFKILRESPPQTVFVHCEFGQDRTGVMIASYRIAFEHWSSDQALSEMLAFGFNRFWHPSMASFIRTLPSRLRSDETLQKAIETE